MERDFLSGEAIIKSLKASGIGTVLSVTARYTEKGLLRRISEDAGSRHVRVAKEDKTIGA